MKNLLTCTLIIVLAVASGCGLGTQDPLLFDEDGAVRSSADRDEVEAAGIPACADFEGFEAADSEIIVPVEGGPGDAMLVGLGGLALCVSDGGEDLGDIDDIGDEVKPDENHPADLDGDSGEGDDKDALLQPQDGQPRGRSGRGTMPRSVLLWDPTPEPATN